MQNFITIPKPCNENWHAMTPTEQGRFCTQCSEVVTDFSNMSNKEILSHLKTKKGNVCGRLTLSQLKTTPTLNDKLKKFLYAFATVFLAFLPIKSFSQVLFNTMDLISEDAKRTFTIRDKENNSLKRIYAVFLRDGEYVNAANANHEGVLTVTLKTGTYTIVVNGEHVKQTIDSFVVEAGMANYELILEEYDCINAQEHIDNKDVDYGNYIMAGRMHSVPCMSKEEFQELEKSHQLQYDGYHYIELEPIIQFQVEAVEPQPSKLEEGKYDNNSPLFHGPGHPAELLLKNERIK